MSATRFDVLVVYSGEIAKSASDHTYKGKHPFFLDENVNYAQSYEYFLTLCKKNSLKTAFSTTEDIVAPGTCSSYWTYTQGQWHRVQKSVYAAQVFTKFLPVNSRKVELRERLCSNEVISFNKQEITQLFIDKYLTHIAFRQHSVPTILVDDRSQVGIRDAIKRLRNRVKTFHYGSDFSKEIVVKDRFGSGGNNVYKLSDNYVENLYELVGSSPDVVFVIQPFLLFDEGYVLENEKVTADIRLLVQNGKLFQTYIRVASLGDFRCNEHQGGTLIYTKLDQIPKAVMQLFEKVILKLPIKNSFFALDFALANSGHAYLLEGNSSPGLDWDVTSKKNELMTKQIIRRIVDELSLRQTGLMSRTSSVYNPIQSHFLVT